MTRVSTGMRPEPGRRPCPVARLPGTCVRRRRPRSSPHRGARVWPARRRCSPTATCCPPACGPPTCSPRDATNVTPVILGTNRDEMKLFASLSGQATGAPVRGDSLPRSRTRSVTTGTRDTAATPGRCAAWTVWPRPCAPGRGRRCSPTGSTGTRCVPSPPWTWRAWSGPRTRSRFPSCSATSTFSTGWPSWTTTTCPSATPCRAR